MRRTRWIGILGLAAVLPLFFSLPARAQEPEVAAPQGAANPAGVTAFVGVNLVPMDHEGIVPAQTVIVRNGTIAEVGPSDRTAVPAGATVVDGSGKYLLPGLVDAHMHLDPLVQARPDFGDGPVYLAYGATTVFNLRGSPEQLEWRRRIQEGSLLAPTLYTSGEFVNEPRVLTPDEVEREVEAQARAGYDMIKYHQVVDDKTWEDLTTTWLPLPSYLRMNETARRLKIPLLGHGPYNLGLGAALQAHQSIAHVGEFMPLYFFPARHAGAYQALAAFGFLTLLASLLFWGAAGLVRRLRRRPAPERPPKWSRVRTVSGWLLLAAFLALVCWVLLFPGGLLTGEVWLLVVLGALGLLLGAGAALLLIETIALWRAPGARWPVKVHACLLTLGAIALAAAAGHYVPLSRRASDAGIARMARDCRKAGIWVQSTLVVYETGFGTRDGYKLDQLVKDPAFQYLPPPVQKEWKEPGPPLPGFLVALFGRYPAFARKVTGALNREGVPLMAGTDAMGMTLVMPGDSLHRELRLLVESGLTPYQAIYAATAAPAVFLGKQGEFGTVAPGRRADLLLVEGDPLLDLSALERPLGVMARGRWLPKEKLQEMLAALKTGA